MLKSLLAQMKGKKTYTVVILSLIYIVVGLYLKQITIDQAVQLGQVALAAGGLRAAMGSK